MNRPDLTTDLGFVTLKNPVLTASGTFGSGEEYSDFIDISRLGAVITKGVSRTPWEGNESPRIAETPSGMLNSIGLENPGVDVFLKRDLPFLKNAGATVGVNVCGHTEDEYVDVVKRLDDPAIAFLEINISCPNVKAGALAFGTDPAEVEKITKLIKKNTRKPVVMKLTPNVTDIKEIAKAAEAGGADGISLINTITGMKIDVEKQTFELANKTGGLSGPAIHPVAVRMVYEAAAAVKIPIIGMGGISDWKDAVEMMLAGASAVAVGAANFYNPEAAIEIIDGIEKYLDDHDIDRVSDIVGAVH
ncbi:MAG: dihydroorotate dehydrogenase [Lachnospiraceae bacterium]|uniref:Dihydroorotate dehydrogenase n=1 Tax=Candidatus Weimeria bifida TaxID=2599074 RepID=A0A6N7J1L6_9FIRM|nr:dihydroorotate dehydrogenase [Candidatus Weimeria bifida]RRF96601.1 MAG: dihydroorotate dehydrogenase [Lachnospiraceae bacterium]